MAQAGVVPEELKLKGTLEQARSQFHQITDPVLRKTAMDRLADLEVR